MFYRLFFLFFLIINCTSCKKNLFSDKGTNTYQGLDTIVNFSKVDVSPYFKVCETLLEEEKVSCFRENIKDIFTKELQGLKLSSKKEINENIILVLIVNTKGKVSLKKLILSDNIISNFPEFDIAIERIVDNLPKLYPALKRGIPVTTEYKLPINFIVR